MLSLSTTFYTGRPHWELSGSNRPTYSRQPFRVIFVPARLNPKPIFMKTLLKCCLLFALIIGGKLAKQVPPATVATQAPVPANKDIILVHQVLTSEPVPTSTLEYAKFRKPDPDVVSAF